MQTQMFERLFVFERLEQGRPILAVLNGQGWARHTKFFVGPNVMSPSVA